MLISRRGTMLDAQRELWARGPGDGQEGYSPRRLRKGRDRRGEPGPPVPVREGRVSLPACDPSRQVRRDTPPSAQARDQRDPLRPRLLPLPVLLEAPERPGAARPADPRPRQADLA